MDAYLLVWWCSWLLFFCVRLPQLSAFAAVGTSSRHNTYQKLLAPVLRPVRGVLFKLEGVMVDTDSIHVKAFERAFAAMPPFAKRVGQRAQTLRRAVATMSASGALDVDAVIGVLSPTVSAEERKMIRTLQQTHFVELSNQLKPVRGLKPLVGFLQRHHIPVAAVSSSSSAAARATLEAIGLQDFPAVTRDQCETWLPDPEPYVLGLEKLGLHDHQGASTIANGCLVFENSVAGVQAAAKAGIPTIGVTTSFGAEELSNAGAMLAIPHFQATQLWEYLGCRVETSEHEEVEWEDGDDDAYGEDEDDSEYDENSDNNSEDADDETIKGYEDHS